MIFRGLRKFLKPKLKRYPAAIAPIRDDILGSYPFSDPASGKEIACKWD